jgi:hypothetical protein
MNNNFLFTKKLFEEHLNIKNDFKFIESTEQQNTNLFKILDCKKAIDGFLIDKDGSLEPYCIRHQYKVNYKSFTTRFKINGGSFNTEYKKISDAIKNDGLRPTYIIQAYWEDSISGNLLDYKVIKSKELYKFYEDNFNKCRINKAPDGNEFIIAFWSDLDNVNQTKLFI